MALRQPPRVLETSTTTGTGAYTLAGAVAGYQSFAAVGDGNTCQYYAEAVDADGIPNGDWEEGLGTYTASGTTLARSTVYNSSNAGAAVSWGAGTKRVGVCMTSIGAIIVGGKVGVAPPILSSDFAGENRCQFLFGDPNTVYISRAAEGVSITLTMGPNSSIGLGYGTNDVSFDRVSAGLARIGDGAGGIIPLQAKKLIEANTAGSGAPNVLTSVESRTVLTNEGAVAQNYHTLPTAAAGLEFEFVVQDSDGIRVVASSGDTIRDGATVSAAAGFIQSTTVGSTLRLLAINATEWIVMSKQGTWTIDS